jgi:hypothetical protein
MSFWSHPTDTLCIYHNKFQILEIHVCFYRNKIFKKIQNIPTHSVVSSLCSFFSSRWLNYAQDFPYDINLIKPNDQVIALFLPCVLVAQEQECQSHVPTC